MTRERGVFPAPRRGSLGRALVAAFAIAAGAASGCAGEERETSPPRTETGATQRAQDPRSEEPFVQEQTSLSGAAAELEQQEDTAAAP